ncbi:MAG: MmcQ/YjbR family DNA-binding protein [Clostridiales bacterium]|nr:MmcQ/YjbR family DNA-binding protein [Clostridiales bacterium]
MTCQELIDFCLTFPAAYEDYPFDEMTGDGAWAVMRHRTNKKSFAFIYERNGKLCINLKCEPVETDFLRQLFSDVTPAYHMNKVHWNTVALGGDVPDDELCRMIGSSYDLIKPKVRRKTNKREPF